MFLSRFRMALRHGGSVLALGASLSVTSLAASMHQIPSGEESVRPYQNGWGFDQAGMDLSVHPGDDFFAYANGTYMRNLKIPDDMSSFGPFRILYMLSQARQKTLLDKAATHQNISDEAGKLGIYYASYLDQKAVDRLGVRPLQADLTKIRAVHDRTTLARLFGEAAHSLMFSTFSLGIEQNQADPEHYMLVLDQGMSIGVEGGLGLPDISYYTNPKLASTKSAYRAYVAKMLELLGWPDAANNASAVVALETDLAKVETPRDKTRDPLETFNPMPVKKLVALAPETDWMTLLESMGVPTRGLGERIINVREPNAIAAMSKVLARTDMATLQAWLAFHLADNAAPYLSHGFSDASFAFNGKVLNGLAQQPVRWKRAVSATNMAMGWALGRIYVQHYFPPQAKQQITSLVQELKAAFRQRLEHNSWMDTKTRQAALNKLDHFAVQVGYPQKWWNYGALEIRRGDVYGNATRATAFNWQHQLARLDRPVDRDDWDMTPQTVNAYNDPTMNEIVFPAAILQAPFFDPKTDMAVNYGGIGGVIGHEMSHGFDDQGRHYDAQGRLHDWWSAESSKAFEKLAKHLGAQYDAQEILPGLHVNGTMTMGENIADLGGLNLALQAYHNSLHGESGTVVHGLTGEQRVFLGWAQVWREKDRPDALRRQVLSNEHAPAITRVNMPAHNIDAWYKAFNVQSGQKLYLPADQRVKIW